MAKRASLRASDADRDAVAERLRKAAQEGRILAHELEDRLATALRAKTYGELDAVTADLPGAHVPRGSSRRAPLARRQPAATVAILVAVTLVTFVIAALVLAGIVAFSGVWILFAFFWFTGGPRHRRRRPSNTYRAYRRNAIGRW
jgi:hypothetical protein